LLIARASQCDQHPVSKAITHLITVSEFPSSTQACALSVWGGWWLDIDHQPDLFAALDSGSSKHPGVLNFQYVEQYLICIMLLIFQALRMLVRCLVEGG
jgi:hypothetical protein